LIGEDVKANLSDITKRIVAAQELYVALTEEGVVFGAQTQPDHLDQWLEAISSFSETASI
jgi:hypothetical protein